jgi:hypothetical protein
MVFIGPSGAGKAVAADARQPDQHDRILPIMLGHEEDRRLGLQQVLAIDRTHLHGKDLRVLPEPGQQLALERKGRRAGRTTLFHARQGAGQISDSVECRAHRG